MRERTLLDELVDLARRRNLTVRREPMSRGTSVGGFCVLRGSPTVFVDERASMDAQIGVLAGVLRRYDWSDVYIPPALRAFLGREAEADEPRAAPAS